MIKDSLENSMPSDFDSQRYAWIANYLAPRQEKQKDESLVFMGGWRGIAFRFLTCALEDEAYKTLTATHGVSPHWPPRFEIDRALFNFFVNGLAALESFCYGLFGIGALVNSAAFPTQTAANLKSITPKLTLTKFTAEFPTDNITTLLDQTLNDQSFANWSEARNVLAHRIAPGRILYGSVGGGPPPPPDAWNLPNPIDLDAQTTQQRREWLAKRLESLVSATQTFCQARL